MLGVAVWQAVSASTPNSIYFFLILTFSRADILIRIQNPGCRAVSRSRHLLYTTEVAELSRLNKNVLKMSLDNYQSAGPVLLATARLTFRERERGE